MEISTVHLGHKGKASSIIEITVTDWSGDSRIIEDVTDLNGKIDESFINSLREIADELEEQNNLIKEAG